MLVTKIELLSLHRQTNINNTDMETTKKTRLQAFEEAQKTGQIEITEPTARAMAELMKMDKAFWNIVEVFQSPYPNDPKYQDEISDQYSKLYLPLYHEILNGWVDYIENAGGLSELDFKGL